MSQDPTEGIGGIPASIAERTLYHGTAEGKKSWVLKGILANGILPRSIAGHGNFDGQRGKPSASTRVYLGDHLPGLYAASAQRRLHGRWLILEVERAPTVLPQQNFVPDEDALANVERPQLAGPTAQQVSDIATRVWPEERQWWVDLLEAYGTVAYEGTVPVSAISRYSLFDPKSVPQISRGNKKVRLVPEMFVRFGGLLSTEVVALRPPFQAMCRWLFGEAIDIEEIEPLFRRKDETGKDLAYLLQPEHRQLIVRVFQTPTAYVRRAPF